jgi:ATP-dependent DNA ligase
LLVNGRPVINEPLKTRQERLRKLVPRSAGRIVRSKTVVGRGSELFTLAQSLGFDGIVAKRLDSPYEPGKRSKNWLKIIIKAAAAEDKSPANAKRRHVKKQKTRK